MENKLNDPITESLLEFFRSHQAYPGNIECLFLYTDLREKIKDRIEYLKELGIIKEKQEHGQRVYCFDELEYKKYQKKD